MVVLRIITLLEETSHSKNMLPEYKMYSETRLKYIFFQNRRLSTVSCSVNSKYFDPRFYTIGSTDKKGCKLVR